MLLYWEVGTRSDFLASSLKVGGRDSVKWGREVPLMKALARSLVVVLVALIAVPALVVSTAITSAVQLLAVTGFYMGGTQHPLSIPPDTAQFITDYMNLADQNYIVPATGVAPN